MPTSSSSSAQAALQRLADQLREMRLDAGLTGREFARRAGWRDATTVSKIENGRRPASAAQVLLWCRVCGASERRAQELLAEQRVVASTWQTHRQLNRGGLKGRQEVLRDKYWRVKLHRVYQTKVIPGLLQTPALATHYLTTARMEQHLTIDDVPQAVEVRMERQRCLERPGARWLFVLEEDVLWYRPATDDIHAEQLRHLLTMTRRPTIVVGVIPRRAERHGICPEESFTMSQFAPDDSVVTVELVSGTLTLTQPYEIGLYNEAWDRLWSLALHGDAARALVSEALDDVSGAG